MIFDYDDNDVESIYNYAVRLVDKSFKTMKDEYDASLYSNYENKQNNIYRVAETKGEYSVNPNAKGQLGNFVEACVFGYKPNGNQEADFPNVGVELKMTCIDVGAKGQYRAGERLSITNISYQNAVEEDFFKSHVWNKIQLILLIHYIRDKSIERMNYKVKYVNYFTPPESDLKFIIEDYNYINSKIKEGRADELSEGDTKYLGACTKGKNAESSLVEQKYYSGHTNAKKRNFCLKSSYMNYLLQEYVVNDCVPYKIPSEDFYRINNSQHTVELEDKSIFSSEELKSNLTFEEITLSKLDKYVGKLDSEIARDIEFDVEEYKSYWSGLALRMLGAKSNKAPEFEKAGIVIKTIRLEENGGLNESMSLPAFSFEELVKEDWEYSKLYEYLATTKFLFVVFRKTKQGCRLVTSFYWNLPNLALQRDVKQEWLEYQYRIANGVSFNEVQYGDKTRINNNLPKMKDTVYIHMRPHTGKAAYQLHNGYKQGNIQKDGDLLPNGEYMTKQSFWLNKTFIIKLINEHIGEM